MGSVQPESSKAQTWMTQLFPEHLNLGSPHTLPVLETELTAPFHASIFLIDKPHAGLAYHNFTDILHGGLVYGSLFDILVMCWHTAVSQHPNQAIGHLLLA